MNDDKYVVLCHERGIIGIGTRRAYGIDVVAFAEGIEYSLVFDDPEEFTVIGILDEDVDPDDLIF